MYKLWLCILLFFYIYIYKKVYQCKFNVCVLLRNFSRVLYLLNYYMWILVFPTFCLLFIFFLYKFIVVTYAFLGQVLEINYLILYTSGSRRDRMVVGFITTYAISAYYHWCCVYWALVKFCPSIQIFNTIRTPTIFSQIVHNTV
jgi:hypothetical protein